ncbi:hypothetical protein J6590_061203 [Homalodisca vitripennis]|nr:hypothetical protein J6590_061203 [Homalodisca vitripennis]
MEKGRDWERVLRTADQRDLISSDRLRLYICAPLTLSLDRCVCLAGNEWRRDETLATPGGAEFFSTKLLLHRLLNSGCIGTSRRDGVTEFLLV